MADHKHEEQQARQRREATFSQEKEGPDLDNMSHEELMDYAREQGFEGLSSDMTEDEIVQMLRGEV